MATASQGRGSIDVNESSPLLAPTNPPVTAAGGGIIREVWYNTLRSIFLLEWMNIRESFDGSWRAKLQAIFKCLFLPWYVLTGALDGQRRYSKQNGIVYTYIFVYLGVTIILDFDRPDNIQPIFLISTMVFAIILMLHLLRNVYRTAIFPTSPSRYLRIFYETGLFVFGFSSFGYSIAAAVECSTRGDRLNVAVSGIEAVFTFLQIVFFHYFYKARIPKDTWHIDIILAHLFGTNLGLWFWTLRDERNVENLDYSVRKYFPPLFVEFLLLAASLFYELWKDLRLEDTISLSPRHMCTECQRVLYRNLLATNDGDSQSAEDVRSAGRTRHPGMIIGGCFAALFIVFIILAKYSGYPIIFKGFRITYFFVIIILYLAQMCACYICQVSLHFHQRDPELFPLDHEDTLLYFSLAGAILLNGYIVYIITRNHYYKSFDIIILCILAILQQLFQTTTLVRLRSHQHTPGRSQVWIRECLLFLLITNVTLWCQDSLFIELDITRVVYSDLAIIVYLVHPLKIFYRFHSSLCCVLPWNQ